MTTFVIDTENNIIAFTSQQEAEAVEGEQVPQITHVFWCFLVLGRDGDPHLVAYEGRTKPSRAFFIYSALIQHAHEDSSSDFVACVRAAQSRCSSTEAVWYCARSTSHEG